MHPVSSDGLTGHHHIISRGQSTWVLIPSLVLWHVSTTSVLGSVSAICHVGCVLAPDGYVLLPTVDRWALAGTYILEIYNHRGLKEREDALWKDRKQLGCSDPQGLLGESCLTCWAS